MSWTVERRQAQAERMRARNAARTPAERAAIRAKKHATWQAKKAGGATQDQTGAVTRRNVAQEDLAAVSRSSSGGLRPESRPTSRRFDSEGSQHPRSEAGAGPAGALPSPVPTCPLLGALLGQVVQTLAHQHMAPVAAAAVPDRLEAEVLRAAVELVEASGEDGVAWFALYAGFFRIARAYAAQLHRRVA